MKKSPTGYAARVAELEAEGMTTSDAQGVADAENLNAENHIKDFAGAHTVALNKKSAYSSQIVEGRSLK